ncbi:TPA: ABC transporter ATP-binding protein [Candidatus Micrarchaeota archaeon]|nr:ABC transporter ATP-binding protein [Candidatus Micrarchaeota archaeon]HIH29798.1 ABC transporter ATP-binding protein [Candidatus Micrarchaeota archaeon]
MARKNGELIKLEKVCKIYPMGEDKLYALNNVDLVINRGEFSSILGPSGSGKSTLLHILGLLDEPSSGRIYLDDMEMHRLNENERARLRGKKIGFIFQMFNLIPSLTVLENVTLPALIYEASTEEAEAKARKTLENIGMEQRLFHYPNQLSGGQRQRVAIARALINDPEIIFADEPTGNLDTKTGHDVLTMFHDLHESGKTIIIVTHDLGITKMTHRTIRIVDGKIVKS